MDSVQLQNLDLVQILKKTRQIQALCVSIQEYASGGKLDGNLANCENDAKRFCEHLQQLDADSVLVSEIQNTTKSSLISSFLDFSKTVKGSKGLEIVFCYIAAQAVEIDGVVYLLPSDFSFDIFEKNPDIAVKQLALPLDFLLKQIENGTEKLSPKPARIYLIDCRRNDSRELGQGAVGACLSSNTSIDFDQSNGILVVSCQSGQSAEETAQFTSSPFARELIKALFMDDQPVQQALSEATKVLKLNGISVNHSGFLDPILRLDITNRSTLIAPDIQAVLCELSSYAQLPVRKEETRSQAGTRCSANVYVASTTESDADLDEMEEEADDCLVAGHNSESINSWEGKMKALVFLMKGDDDGNGWTKPMLLMSSFMRIALSEVDDMKLWYAVCDGDCKTASDLPKMVRCFLGFLLDPHFIRHPLGSIISSYHASYAGGGISPVKYVMNIYVKGLLKKKSQRQRWSSTIDPLMNDVLSDVEFLNKMDKILNKYSVFDDVFKNPFAIQSGSFVLFFKLSRLEMLFFAERMLSSPKVVQALADAGFRCFVSNFKEYGHILLHRHVAIPPEFRSNIFRRMCRLARINMTEFRSLAATCRSSNSLGVSRNCGEAKSMDGELFSCPRLQTTKMSDLIRSLNGLAQLDISTVKEEDFPSLLFGLTSHSDLKIVRSQLTNIPGWVENLTWLTELDLSDLKAEALPAWLSNLTGLAVLNLAWSQVSKIPGWIGNLTGLTELDLTNSKVEELPESFSNLTRLAILHLAGSQIKTTPQCISTLTGLTFLDLMRHQRRERLACSSLTDLTCLDLGSVHHFVMKSAREAAPGWGISTVPGAPLLRVVQQAMTQQLQLARPQPPRVPTHRLALYHGAIWHRHGSRKESTSSKSSDGG